MIFLHFLYKNHKNMSGLSKAPQLRNQNSIKKTPASNAGVRLSFTSLLKVPASSTAVLAAVPWSGSRSGRKCQQPRNPRKFQRHLKNRNHMQPTLQHRNPRHPPKGEPSPHPKDTAAGTARTTSFPPGRCRW